MWSKLQKKKEKERIKEREERPERGHKGKALYAAKLKSILHLHGSFLGRDMIPSLMKKI